MIEFVLILIIVFIFGLLVNAVQKVQKGCRSKINNSDQFFETIPAASDLPKNNIKDSHWFIKTFLRPRKIKKAI